MTGADDHQKKLATIATNVQAGPGGVSSVKYHVPNVSPPGQIYFLMFQTKDNKATAWATRFTITDAAGNPGTLRPVIPAGGKINPGGNGSIVSAPVKFNPRLSLLEPLFMLPRPESLPSPHQLLLLQLLEP
ncbi:MAG: hypothetical protein BYD32DRAFT_260553 [Podila humilis]|nr:MAG: hypothetical protein BYD32DRAFT_260553 [Podila humilis]